MNAGLTRYVVRRLIQAVFLMLLITLLNFVIMRLAPGGPAQFAEDPRIGHEYRDAHAGVVRPERAAADPVPQVAAERGPTRLRLLVHRPAPGAGEDRRAHPGQLPALDRRSFLLGLFGIPLGVVRGAQPGPLARSARARVHGAWQRRAALVARADAAGAERDLPRIFPLGGMYTEGNGSLLDRLWHLACRG